MPCNDHTPWTITEHPYTINRLRASSGGGTNQSTGAWVKETMDSLKVCGYIGQGTAAGTRGMRQEELQSLAGATFKTGDQLYMCKSECDVALNDLIEVFEDGAGTEKTYWRVITKLKDLQVFRNISGYGMAYWLVRKEER